MLYNVTIEITALYRVKEAIINFEVQNCFFTILSFNYIRLSYFMRHSWTHTVIFASEGFTIHSASVVMKQSKS